MDLNLLLKKIATGDFSWGWLLNAEQAAKFISYVFDESVMKNSARMVTMNSEIMEISKLGVGNRVAKAKSEGTSPSTGDFVGIDTDTIELIQKRIVIPRKITQETFDYNIEGDGFEDTVLKMIATQLANDLEELFLNGDTSSTDPYLALMNGWLNLMTVGGHSIAAWGTLNKTVFSKLKKALPTKYRRNMKNLRFFVNSDDMQDYRDSLASRDTNLGDQAVTGEADITIFGTPAVEVPMLPQGTVILTHKDNFIVGMNKMKIKLLKDENIFSDEKLYAMHMGVACEIENTDAIAYTTDVTPVV
jgi:HK97 family phage major capsid protein